MISKWISEVLRQFEEEGTLDIKRLERIDNLFRKATYEIDDDNLHEEMVKEINNE